MDLAHEPPIRLGGLLVRPSTREVEGSAGREQLEPRVMEVLITLARAEGAVVSRDDLITACWDGRAVTDDAINRVVSRIRRLAAATGERDFKLETITKVGYRLLAAPPPDEVNAGAGMPSPVDDAGSVGPASSALPRPLAHRQTASLAAMALAAVVLGGMVVARFLPGDAPPPTPPAALTLAVLPFDRLSGASETGYLAEGLSRELRNSLSRLRGLRVISDSSSFAAAAEPLGAVEIGARLGAELLLDGSVRQSDGQLRVTLELVDADTGAQSWTESVSFPADDLAGGEQALFLATFEELVRRLGPDRVERFAPVQRGDPAAYRQVLEAREIVNRSVTLRQQGRLEEYAAAIEDAERAARAAVARAPDDAEALLLLARIVGGGWAPDPVSTGTPEPREEALELFRRALTADPDNPAALTILAERHRFFDWRWAEAETLVRRALAIDPNHADAHTTYAYLLAHVGRCVEGLEHAQASARLDPEFLWRRLAEPRLLKCAGRRPEADALYARYLDEDRQQAFLASEIYFNRMSDGDAAALRAFAAHIRDDLWGGETVPEPMAALLVRMDAGAEALEGRPEALLEILEVDGGRTLALARSSEGPTDVGRSPSSTFWTLAVEFAAAGAHERAVDFLELSVAAGSLYVPETMPYGAYEFTPEVRADPRYQALWRSDPRLVELVDARRRSAEDRQMETVRPDGRRVSAKMD